MLKRIMLICFMLLIISNTSHAYEFDYYNIRTFAGVNSLSIFGCESDHEDYTWGSVGYLMGKRINSWLDVQPVISASVITNGYDDSFGINGRLLFDIHKNIFYMKIGGGVGHYFNTGKFESLHNSWLYGLISGEIGIRFQTKTREFSIGYIQEHISSPFHSNDDSGINVGGIVANIQIFF